MGKVLPDRYVRLPLRKDLDIVGTILNLTAAEPEADGYFVAWPEANPLPATSNVNFAPGQTVANLVASGTSGSFNAVAIGNIGGPAHMIVDIQGVFVTTTDTGDRFQGVAPFRVLDTRSGLGTGVAGPLVENSEVAVDMRARGVPPEASAVVMNVTVNQPTAVGYVSVWPSTVVRPNVSNINFGPGQTVPNAVVVPIGPDGKVRFYNAFGATHLIADVTGWFT